MTVLGLDHVSVTCADLDRSLAFYHGALGIPVAARGDLEGGSAAEIMGVPGLRLRFADLALGDGRLLELLEVLHPASSRRSVSPGDTNRQRDEPGVLRAGAGHLALRVADAGEVFDRLRAAGYATASRAPVTIEGDGDWDGARAFYALDPDGMTVELLERAAP